MKRAGYLLLAVLTSTVFSLNVSSQSLDPFFQPGKVRALILSGYNNHDWRLTTPRLKEILVATGRFDVRVTEEPRGLTASTLAPYQVLVLDYQGPRLGPAGEKAIQDFVASGGGLVVVHGASYGFSGLDVLGDGHAQTGLVEEPWGEFINLTGGIWSKSNPETAHGDRHTFKVEVTKLDHPITRGVEDFWATDELYHNLKMIDSVHVLATAFSRLETRGTGEEEPILWTVEYGKGRVFQTVLGHDLVAMAEPGFATTLARGCEWAATGAVTLPSRIDLIAREPNALRLLVVTGGHDFQTEFYSLFAGNWVAWDHAPSNEAAFAGDIRDRFDVVLLYDLSPDLSEKGRRNLRQFLEAGKGVVVMHHALADYNAWSWWWKEVVGCRYILDNSDGAGSTYQHDVEMFVRPVARHPVVAGMSPLHYVDETYKRMWFSPGNQVLLQADVPSSDGPVAWVSPYRQSRVLVIQLGHDRQAYLYPGFQDLVRRAVSWSGGRLE